MTPVVCYEKIDKYCVTILGMGCNRFLMVSDVCLGGMPGNCITDGFCTEENMSQLGS